MNVFADSYAFTLAATTALRGIGAGIITGVLLITLPTRRRIGLVPYAEFTRALYRGAGVRAYAAITIIGALLTVVLAFEAFSMTRPAAEKLAIAASVLATMLGFVGTGGAFPAMLHLWRASDDDELLIATLLNRFATWGLFSAAWHVVAFLALVLAQAAR